MAEEVRARNERDAWSTTDELLATLIELTSIHRVEFLASLGVKSSDLPEPVHIRRPGEPDKQEGNAMSMGQFARHLVGL